MNLEEIKEHLIKTGIFNHGGYYNPNYKLPDYIDLSEIEGETLKEKVWVIFKNNGIHPVDKIEKYRDNIVWEISNKSHFSKNKEYVVLL